ncbi:hypothetical protein [Photobacterium leiognathi]|uniref:hypothetical protein n=1 Tax=Photobacterium leiognathi TaxID=553611 RepID=UPI002981DD6A|nr:hypothetical protein [Photobacterium leiognathi]
MPRKLRINDLNLDISSVKNLLESAEKYGDFLAKKQYLKKLDKLESQLELIKNEQPTNASVALFFDGEPVHGSKGILASFAGNSLDTFQELINKLFAARENGCLGARGAIAHKQNSSLMVTGVAKGSFGFILDEVSDQFEMTETSLKVTLDEVLELIEATTLTDEDAFSNAIESIDRRVLQSLKAFFTTLDKAKSTLRIVGDKHEYRLNSQSIRLARKRTEATSISENEKETEITILGFLPESCKFEALDKSHSLISGTILKQVAKQLPTGRKKIRVKMLTKTIRPFRKPEKILYKIIEFLD